MILLLSYHVYSFSAPNGPIKFYRIRFSLGLLLLISTNRKMYYQELKSHEKLNPIVNLTQNQFKYVTTVTDSIYKELQSETEQKSYLSISLTSFLNYIYQKQRTNTNKLPTEKTLKWKVLQYMNDHHSMPLGIDMVAKQFDLSSGEVQQILQELTGTTFKNNMNRIRLRNAVALMQFDELSIVEIRKICGFSSDGLFYDVFKKEYGVLPKEYRQSLEEYTDNTGRTDAWEIYIYLQKNYRMPLTLTDISNKLHINKKQIERLLRESFSLSFKEMLNGYRVVIGRNLLVSTDKNVQEVASTVGFSQSSSFIQAFQKVYQDTPKQYVEAFKRKKQSNK
ncbi:helix-turn-helix transcriptional regulator [Vagococcus jeotgali]|uniref:helix-turn-helix transcriptional regulator n=1 Tax=Vagococcus jeotgali TaxID=3109030 RepID=UPI002DDA8CE4|nr:AraC family transcriptional regulator [Vagococcus sp. B2T-5]